MVAFLFFRRADVAVDSASRTMNKLGNTAIWMRSSWGMNPYVA